MTYRGPGFLAIVWFGSYPTHSPSPISKLCLFSRRGCGRSQIKSYDGEKAWSSINLSILSAINCSRSNETLTPCNKRYKEHTCSSSNWKSKSHSSKIFNELWRPHVVKKKSEIKFIVAISLYGLSVSGSIGYKNKMGLFKILLVEILIIYFIFQRPWEFFYLKIIETFSKTHPCAVLVQFTHLFKIWNTWC